MWSNPRGSVSQSQECGCLVHPTGMIHDISLCLLSLWTIQYIAIYICFEFEETKHILFFQLRKVQWMHMWNLWGSVPPKGWEPMIYGLLPLNIKHLLIFLPQSSDLLLGLSGFLLPTVNLPTLVPIHLLSLNQQLFSLSFSINSVLQFPLSLLHTVPLTLCYFHLAFLCRVQ